MRDNELLDFFIQTGAVSFGYFTGKSGNAYNIETDLRESMRSFSSAMILGEKVYRAIKQELGYFHPVIGVPETGTYLACYINLAYYNDQKCDFYANMLRAAPKEYQASTSSVNTVIPLNTEQEYILIEDDVVTGNTLLKYLERALVSGLKIAAVVSVFGRESADKAVSFCQEKRIDYYELIKVNEIKLEG